jgi:hypothetical protein
MDVWELNPAGLRSYWLTSNAIFCERITSTEGYHDLGEGDNVAAVRAAAIIIPWNLLYN